MKMYRSLPNRKLFLCLIALAITFLVGAMLSDQLPAQPPAGDLNVEIRAGEAVVPSEFVGDVRDLPQLITPEERKEFHPPLELEFEVPLHKKPLPGAELGEVVYELTADEFGAARRGSVRGTGRP